MTFDAAGRVSRDNSQWSPRRAEPGQWLLRGLVKCGVCQVGTNCHKMRGRNGTWHRWALRWTPSGLTFYLDDAPIWSRSGPISQRGQFIILSSEIGAFMAGQVPQTGRAALGSQKMRHFPL